MPSLTEQAKLQVLQCGRPAKVSAAFAQGLEDRLNKLIEFIKQPEVIEHLTPDQLAKLDALLTDSV